MHKTKALIHTYVKTLQNLYPGIKNARYDFATKQFIGGNGLPIRRGDGPGSFNAAGAGPKGRAARAGEASLRRGIFLQSLISSESSERPGILEEFLSRPAQFVSEEGGLAAVFRRSAGAAPADAPEFVSKIRQSISDAFQTQKTFNWWHKSVGTQFHKAQVDSDFSKVYNLAQKFVDDTRTEEQCCF